MRKISLATIGAMSVAAMFITMAGTPSALAQAPEMGKDKKIFGYQDPKTGVFHPLSRVEPETTPAPPFTGTYEVAITITLKTPVPAGYSVYCTTSINASAINDSTAAEVDFEEDAYSLAKVTGSTATCTVNTPYSWVIPQATTTETDSLAGTYTVEMIPTSTTAPDLGRDSTGPFLSATKIPAAGTTTKISVAATL